MQLFLNLLTMGQSSTIKRGRWLLHDVLLLARLNTFFNLWCGWKHENIIYIMKTV